MPGRYDLAHLRAFHREILGDLYPWAGELRTVAIAKTAWFCLPQHFGQLALDADWPIDWSRLDPRRNTEASIASLRGDNGPLRALLNDLVVAA